MTKPRVFEIPSPNFPRFQDRWVKLVRRATKLNVPLPTYTIIKEEPREITETERYTDKDGCVGFRDVKSVVLYYHITIEHPQVVVEGWEFVSAIEHTSEGNITHNISGKDLPIKYRSTDAYCDHCKLDRRRKETFVIVNEGTYRQIGRNCLSDYLGRDGEKYAAMAEIYFTASELGEASEGESFGGGGERFDFLEPFLAHVAEVISLEGWLSRTNAKKYSEERGRNIPATADIAYQHMHPSPFQKREDRLYDRPSEKSIELAKTSIEWCSNLPDNEVDASEYLSNIRIIARRGLIGGRQYGYAGSIVSGYQRTLADKANKERIAKENAASNYVGEVGKRVVIEVVCNKVLAFDGAYGTTHIHLMNDLAGNCLVWKSSSTVLDVGKTVKLKATIKAHEERKGTKQTLLSRCVEMKKRHP